MVDWGKSVDTTAPDYYRWTQWVFLQLYKRGLAYKKKAAVNWCPSCKTVLANEQVVGGACERCGTIVEQRLLEQWFFRISDYAERLLNGTSTRSTGPTPPSTAQRNWIGRGARAREMRFPVAGASGPGPEHGRHLRHHGLHDPPRHALRRDVHGARAGASDGGDLPDDPGPACRGPGVSRSVPTKRWTWSRARWATKDKTGVFTRIAYAINPATGKEVPVWIADYVLMEYGTGAIMAVPGARRARLRLRDPVSGSRSSVSLAGARGHGSGARSSLPFTEDAAGFPGELRAASMGSRSPRRPSSAITAWLAERRGSGRRWCNYRLHDWCISRQRYWGPPIPDRLLRRLRPAARAGAGPAGRSCRRSRTSGPTTAGISPLARHEEWYSRRLPRSAAAQGAARDRRLGHLPRQSAWYYLRYPSVGHADRAVRSGADHEEAWLPGEFLHRGQRARGVAPALLAASWHDGAARTWATCGFEEPFTSFRAHGLIIKRRQPRCPSRRGNVVIPDAFIDAVGGGLVPHLPDVPRAAARKGATSATQGSSASSDSSTGCGWRQRWRPRRAPQMPPSCASSTRPSPR
jgi:leucyl-tRNA synthetase